MAVGEVLAETALRVHCADVDQRQELVRRAGQGGRASALAGGGGGIGVNERWVGSGRSSSACLSACLSSVVLWYAPVDLPGEHLVVGRVVRHEVLHARRHTGERLPSGGWGGDEMSVSQSVGHACWRVDDNTLLLLLHCRHGTQGRPAG